MIKQLTNDKQQQKPTYPIRSELKLNTKTQLKKKFKNNENPLKL